MEKAWECGTEQHKRILAGEFDKGEGVSLSAGTQTENVLQVNPQPEPDAGPASHPLMSAGQGVCWDGISVNCFGGGSDAAGSYDKGALEIYSVWRRYDENGNPSQVCGLQDMEVI